nr:hypothetical protein [Flexivirga aerilata]
MRPFPGGDGAIVRLRVPGGHLRLATMQGLLRVAGEHGAPFLQLTSRANLQVRGLPDPLPDSVVTEIADLGLLPSTTHERVRNILTAPFSHDAAATARRLDRALCARPALAELPGRFLFAVEDTPSAAIAAAGADIVIRPGAVAVRRPDLGYVGRSVPSGGEIPAALDLAEQFLRQRADVGVWRTHQLPSSATLFAGMASWSPTIADPPQPGVHGRYVLAGIPLGLAGAAEVSALTELADRLGTDRVELTPWKAVALPVARPQDVPAALAMAADAGLLVEPAAPVTACIGAPWCARTDVETLPLARQLMARADAPGTALHLSGCARRCGTPARAHIAIVPPSDATPDALIDAWKKHDNT